MEDERFVSCWHNLESCLHRICTYYRASFNSCCKFAKVVKDLVLVRWRRLLLLHISFQIMCHTFDRHFKGQKCLFGNIKIEKIGPQFCTLCKIAKDSVHCSTELSQLCRIPIWVRSWWTLQGILLQNYIFIEFFNL